ncbi:hypothetical protein [Pseudoalteromonas sp. Z9A5]|uniref:hypothetical protein n=1 Tax=Pseudoalteromonas sp. Z9A5 TaxID=2686355 RepID=UPI001F106667|nr:hypothetical protein [Pseudoalteromonas sp. Z9A5]
MLISGSSNHHNVLGFWHVLNAKANAVQSYWQFPRYFSQHLQLLPDFKLALLARNKIPFAQYVYSLRLLKNKRSDTAKLFWQASIYSLSESQRQNLARQLFTQSRWDDLKLLAKNGLLPKGDTLNHLNLKLSAPYTNIPESFIHNLGFLALGSELPVNNQCLFNVVTMSDHRSGLYKLSELIKKYNEKPEPDNNVFCFTKPVYVAGAIDCTNTVNKMAQCNWQSSSLKKQLSGKFDFIIMMPRYGSANVQNNIMQLNSHVNYNVFLHELMHFSGFEDEYALPNTKQAWLCSKKGFVAPNLFISHGEPAPKGWYKSESCQQGGTAYKPSKTWSIMEYQQIGLSEQYRALWQAHIKATPHRF